MTIDNSYQLENPHETTVKYTGFSGLDKALLSIIAAAGVVVAAATMSLLLAVVFVAVMLLPLYPAEHGRLYRLVYRGYRSWRIRRKGNVIWQSGAQPRARFRRKPPPWKNPLASIGVGEVGVLHHSKGGSDTVVIEGEGSDMASLNLPEQAQAHMLYADAIKRIASVPRYAVGVSSIFQRRPPDMLAYQLNEETTIHPEVAIPAALFKEEDEWTSHDRRMMALALIQHEDEELYAKAACETTMAVSLTVRHETGLASALKGQGMARRKVPRLVLSRIAENAVKGLKTFGATGLAVLDDYGVEDFIRDSWDVVGNNKYRSEMAERRARQAAGEAVSEDPIYWPSSRILAFHDHLVMDDTYIATLRMTRGKRLLTIGEMRQLYHVDIPWVTITLVGETVNSRGGYRMFNFVLNLLDDTKEVFDIRSRGPKSDRLQSDRQQRLADIDRSGYTQSYNIVAVISAPDLDQLEDWTRMMSDHADYLGMKPERVVGEDYQLPAAFSGFTGINML